MYPLESLKELPSRRAKNADPPKLIMVRLLSKTPRLPELFEKYVIWLEDWVSTRLFCNGLVVLAPGGTVAPPVEPPPATPMDPNTPLAEDGSPQDVSPNPPAEAPANSSKSKVSRLDNKVPTDRLTTLEGSQPF